MRLIASFENPHLGAGGNTSLEEYEDEDGNVDMSAVCERYKIQRAEQNSTKGQEGVDKWEARKENRVGAEEEAKKRLIDVASNWPHTGSVQEKRLRVRGPPSAMLSCVADSPRARRAIAR